MWMVVGRTDVGDRSTLFQTITTKLQQRQRRIHAIPAGRGLDDDPDGTAKDYPYVVPEERRAPLSGLGLEAVG